MSLKRTINKILRIANLKVSKLPSKSQLIKIERIKKEEEAKLHYSKEEEERKKILWLYNLSIKTILDIGANTGQFAEKMRKIFPTTMIYSFEPLPECFKELNQNFQGNKLFKAYNIALGQETGEINMYKNDYSPSSSLLPMADLHKQAFEYTQNTTFEKIRVEKLDDFVAKEHLHIDFPLMIKLDVQGYEDKVIKGGKNLIQSADIIICELSMEKLYEGQPLFDDIYTLLKKMGFQYRGNYEQLLNPNDGRVVQADGIFIKIAEK